MNKMKEFIEVLENNPDKAYDFISNNYYKMTKDELANIAKELLYAMYDKMTKAEHNEALADAAEELKNKGIDVAVYSFPKIKNFDAKILVKEAGKYKRVISLEEHSVIGGLGSAVAEVLAEKAPTKMMKIGVNDPFGESGPAVALIKKYGLDAESIYKKVKEFV